MTVQRNHGRAHAAFGSQCFGARATTPTLPSSAMAEAPVNASACGWDADTMGDSHAAPRPMLARANGTAQQAASAKAEAIPPTTKAIALVDLMPSFISAS